MKAMILAAGLGTRLGSLGRVTPKVLVEIGGQPLLAHQLEFLAQHGVERVVINVHPLAERVEAFVDDYDGPLEIVCVREEELLGTAGGVRNALPELEPGPFLVLYGDVVVGQPLHPMLDLHRERDAVATIAVHNARAAAGKGVVDVDAHGRVTGFREKPAGTAGPVLINSGIYVLESSWIARMSRGVVSDFGTDLFPEALRWGLSISTFRLSRSVIDVGTPEGLHAAQSALTRFPDGIPADR